MLVLHVDIVNRLLNEYNNVETSILCLKIDCANKIFILNTNFSMSTSVTRGNVSTAPNISNDNGNWKDRKCAHSNVCMTTTLKLTSARSTVMYS